VIDDALEPGGTLRALPPEEAAAWKPLVARFEQHRAAKAIALRLETTAAALYGDDLLVAGPDGAEVLTARALVLAPGAHDAVLPFEGNDLPGIFSARAAGWMLAHGVLPGDRVVVCVAPGADPLGEAVARALSRQAEEAPSTFEVEVVHGEPLAAEGSARFKGLRVNTAAGEQRVKGDALVVHAPRAPAYELCEQAGASLIHEPRGFVPAVARGKIRDGVFALGEVTGTPLDPRAFAAAAEEIVAAL
jgi:sarcosine oxidase subunit alpha